MEPIKAFSNVIIGQFVLTRIPIRVYVNNRYLKITDTDDVQDPLIGFGMDEDGQMHRYDYRMVQHLAVGPTGNVIDLDTYNKAMGFENGKEDSAKEEEPKEEEPKKEESVSLSEMARSLNEDEFEGAAWNAMQTYGDLQTRIKNIKIDKRWATAGDAAKKIGLAFLPGWVGNTKDAFDFFKQAINQDDAKKAKGFIGKLDVDDELQDIVDDTVEDNFLKHAEKFIMTQPPNKKLDDKFSMNKELQDYLAGEFEKRTIAGFAESVNEMHQGYTFGTGDIVTNKNKSCPHYGSMGVVKKIMDLPNGMGKVAVYRVTNQGPTYKPGDVLTKTLDQLEQYNG